MTTIQTRPNTAFTVFRISLVCEIIVFLSAALLHTGAFGVPALLPAMIVEGLCGIGCAISAYGLFAGKPWALKGAVIVQVLVLLGVLLGVVALTRSPGLRSPLNLSLHGIMLALILIELALLAAPGIRQAFPRRQAL